MSTSTPSTTPATTRRERQREAVYAEIVAAARGLLTEGKELSLRAVAAELGLTAPALYRYVASLQELVELVAVEIDRAATARWAEAADRHPLDDPVARLLAAAVAFRGWALAHPREFSLVFANPGADPLCQHRPGEALVATSGLYMNGLLLDVWERLRFPVPALDELPPGMAEVVVDPLEPIDLTRVPVEDRGVVWVSMTAWAALYGTVTLEVFAHLDPRVVESAAMFRQMVADWVPRLGVPDAEAARYGLLLEEELARTPPL